jgi:cell wall-associated NlpC family hydrolase
LLRAHPVCLRHGGRLRIRRTANEQFHEFHRETHSEAKPGDLVFFHDTSGLSSYVYHVGVYEGKDNMVVESTTVGVLSGRTFPGPGTP